MRLIPLLLLNGRKLEKTEQFCNPVYLGDPINAVRIFSEMGVDELALLNYGRNFLDEDYFEFLEALTSEAFMPISYGGGIKSSPEVERLFAIGFDKVIFNSALVESPEIISWTAKRFGSQSTSLSLNVIEKDSSYYLFNWKTRAINSLDWEHLNLTCKQLGVGEVIVTCVNREGTFQGYDIKLAELVSEVFELPIVFNGGLSELDEISSLKILELDFAASSVFCFVNNSRRSILLNYPAERKNGI